MHSALRVSVAFWLCLVALVSFAAEPTSTKLPDEAECATFGRSLAEMLRDGKVDEVIRLLDANVLVDRTLDGISFDGAGAREFRAGMTESMPKTFKTQFAGITDARFLRVQTVGKDRRALVRTITENGGASYMAFVCTRRGAGPIMWGDVFQYTSGESISESARRTALPLIAEGKKNAVLKLVTSESAYVANFPSIARATQLFQSGKLVEAWAITEKLPPEVQKDRGVLLLRLRLGQAIDDTKYLRVINEWKAAFPADAALEFISVDGDILRKDYTSALAHLEAFSKQIGGDPYLDYLAANILVGAERYDEARKRARLALAGQDDLNDAFDTLLQITLRTKNYAETVSLLTELRARHPEINFEGITSDPDYAEFRLSRAYRDWAAKKK